MKKIIFGLLAAFVALSFMGCPTLHDDLELPAGDWFYIDVDVSGIKSDSGFLFVNSSGSPKSSNVPADVVASLTAGGKVYLSVDNLVASVTDLRPIENSLPAIKSGCCRVFCFNTANLNVMWAWNGITPAGTAVAGFPWGDAPTAGMTKI